MYKKIIALAMLFITGCAHRGNLTLGVPFEDTAKCPKDRYIIYRGITVNTNWETKEQNIEYSWQCTKYGSVDGRDTYRIKEILVNYKPEPPPKREMRERY